LKKFYSPQIFLISQFIRIENKVVYIYKNHSEYTKLLKDVRNKSLKINVLKPIATYVINALTMIENIFLSQKQISVMVTRAAHAKTDSLLHIKQCGDVYFVHWCGGEVPQHWDVAKVVSTNKTTDGFGSRFMHASLCWLKTRARALSLTTGAVARNLFRK